MELTKLQAEIVQKITGLSLVDNELQTVWQQLEGTYVPSAPSMSLLNRLDHTYDYSNAEWKDVAVPSAPVLKFVPIPETVKVRDTIKTVFRYDCVQTDEMYPERKEFVLSGISKPNYSGQIIKRNKATNKHGKSYPVKSVPNVEYKEVTLQMSAENYFNILKDFLSNLNKFDCSKSQDIIKCLVNPHRQTSINDMDVVNSPKSKPPTDKSQKSKRRVRVQKPPTIIPGKKTFKCGKQKYVNTTKKHQRKVERLEKRLGIVKKPTTTSQQYNDDVLDEELDEKVDSSAARLQKANEPDSDDESESNVESNVENVPTAEEAGM